MRRRGWAVAVCLGAPLVVGCYSGRTGTPEASGGADGGGTADDGTADDGEDPVSDEVADEVGATGLRRLSIAEYQATVLDLLGIDAAQAQELLPSDTLTPFDNTYALQIPSEPLVKGLELLAGDLAEAVIADPDLRGAIVPCTPSGADDADCYAQFIATFGRRALRRPLSDSEVERFATLAAHGTEAGDFWVGVSAALRAFLQHPEMIYRVEIGTPVADQPGLFRLSAFEVGTRLSYFVLGTTPPDWLIDAAEAGDLDDPEGIAAAAQQLLEDPQARTRVDRFHALWLGYSTLSREGLYGAMHDETEALLERVIFEDQRPWTDVLTASETWVNAELAAHYGLPAPDGSGAWVSYGDSGRAGLLSHGTFLSVGAKFGDTSPTQRGKLVRTQLFCTEIPDPPPDLMVDVDEPPPAPADACKHERYFMWNEQQCSGCHNLMDPIGFGLEQYDATGAFRTTDNGRPECPLDGEGDFVGLGTFNGPAELGQLAVESGLVEACVARQIYRFATGRIDLDEHDEALLSRLVDTATTDEGLHLFDWISEYVASEAFRLRREEEAP